MRHLAIILLASTAAAPAMADTVTFKPIIDMRLRYENVDQQPIVNDANAVTLRVRSGGELTDGRFSLLGEAQATLALDEDYNSGVNGKDGVALPGHGANYPIVADPQNVALNRLQLRYKSPVLAFTVGRQRINLDDQRFVGSVGWRQNEQTFDAVRAEYTPLKRLKIDLTYAIGVNTIYGIDGGKYGATSKPTRIAGDDFFGNVSYKFAPGTLTAFAYLVDERQDVVALQRNSSQTYGARFTGGMPLSKAVKLSYMASYAHQSDDRNNPIRYSADYAAGELGLDAYRFKLTGGYELLGSDAHATGIAGGYAFQTPFATLHKFNGWADKFLTTPATGLQDYYGGLAYTLPRVGTMGPLVGSFIFHRFDSDRNALHYGDEYDAQLALKIDKHVSALVKYADFRAGDVAAFTDTKKFWLELDYSL